MDELIAFLNARLDEDEAAALPVIDYMWDEDVTKRPDEFYTEAHAHIARHDPARVLADVAAKRLIIEEWEAARTKHQVADVYPERTPTVPMGVLAWVMKALASAYADHPDYREEWRPE